MGDSRDGRGGVGDGDGDGERERERRRRASETERGERRSRGGLPRAEALNGTTRRTLTRYRTIRKIHRLGEAGSISLARARSSNSSAKYCRDDRQPEVKVAFVTRYYAGAPRLLIIIRNGLGWGFLRAALSKKIR